MSFNITRKITLNTNNFRPNSKIIIKQGCIGTVILIVNFNDKGGLLELPEGTAAKFKMNKPDQEPILNDALVTGNEVHITVTEQMQAYAGDASCEVILINEGNTFASATFTITIEASVYNDKKLKSLPEFTSILNALVRVEAAQEIADSAYTTAAEAQNIIWAAEDDLNQFITEKEVALTQVTQATQAAHMAADLANSKADFANTAAQNANSAAEAAETATENTIIATTNAENKIIDVEARFQTLTTEQQRAAEVIDARKGKASLRAKVDEIDTQLEALTEQFTNIASGKIEEVLNDEIVHTEIENKLRAKEEEYAPRLTTVENTLSDVVSKVDLVTIEMQSGLYVHSKVTDDCFAELKIAGATSITPANPDLEISPDSPATIESASDFDIVACGKNLAPNNWKQGLASSTVSNRVSLPLFFLPKGVYYLSNMTSNIQVTVQIYNHITKTFVSMVYDWSTNSGTFILDQNAYILVACRKQDNADINPTEVKDKIQIEKGISATPYEPYKSNNFHIQYELAKLPNGVADTIEYIGNGKAKLIKRLGKVVLDGGADENWTLLNNQTDYVEFRLPYSMGTTGSLSNTNSHFPNKTNSRIAMVSNSIYLRFPKNIQGYPVDVENLKAWLQVNPVTVHYELATPIETIIDLPMLTTYKGTTNIYTNADVQPTITAKFKSRLANAVEVLLSETSKLKQAVISLGGTV